MIGGLLGGNLVGGVVDGIVVSGLVGGNMVGGNVVGGSVGGSVVNVVGGLVDGNVVGGLVGGHEVGMGRPQLPGIYCTHQSGYIPFFVWIFESADSTGQHGTRGIFGTRHVVFGDIGSASATGGSGSIRTANVDPDEFTHLVP